MSYPSPNVIKIPAPTMGRTRSKLPKQPRYQHGLESKPDRNKPPRWPRLRWRDKIAKDLQIFSFNATKSKEGTSCIQEFTHLYPFQIKKNENYVLKISTVYWPNGVSNPSLSLRTISVWPSIRNLGGLLHCTGFTWIFNKIHIITNNLWITELFAQGLNLIFTK